MRALTIILIFFFNLPIILQSQVSGLVKSPKSGAAIPYVQVYLKKTAYITMTDENGHFQLDEVDPGQYTLVTSMIGYTTFSKEINLKKGETRYLTIELEESLMVLPEAVIKSYSMTGGMTARLQIPGSAYYLPLRELKRFEYADPNRVLSSVPGIQIQEEDGFGLRPNIGLRASGVERSSKITVMEDGILAAPAPYSAPAAYYFPTIARMHGIEIMKGSSQIKYGPFTTGGALNLISVPIPQTLSGRVGMSAGSFDTRRTNIELGTTIGQFGIVGQFFNQQSDGFKQLPDLSNTGFDKTDYLLKAQFQTKSHARLYQSIQFKTGYVSEQSNETYLGLTSDDFSERPNTRYAGSMRDQMNTEQFQNSMRYSIAGQNQWHLNLTGYLNEFSRNWYKLDKVADQDRVFQKISNVLAHPENNAHALALTRGEIDGSGLLVKANNRSYVSRGLQATFGQSFQVGNSSHELTIGLRHHFDEVDRFQWVDTFSMQNQTMILVGPGTPGTESNRLESAIATSAFLSHQIQLGQFTFHPGLRMEHIVLDRRDYGKSDVNRSGANLTSRENMITAWIPGLGIEYRINDQTRIFSGVHRGFAPPGSQPDAKPEIGINYELGLRRFGTGLDLELIGFISDYANLLGADLAASGGSGTTSLYNGGKAFSYGLELQAGLDLAKQFDLSNVQVPVQLNYSYTQGRFSNSFDSQFEGWGTVQLDDQLPYLANHRLNLQLGLEFNRCSFSLRSQYVSKMRALPGQGEIVESELIPAHFVTDFSAKMDITPSTSIKGSVFNLFNETYLVALRPAGYRPGLPRMIQIGIEIGI